MTDQRWTYDAQHDPAALDDADPSNTDIDQLTNPLDPDDDVYALLNPDQEAPRETTNEPHNRD